MCYGCLVSETNFIGDILENIVDLTNPEMAYLFGFLQADGHMSNTTRNRGRIQLELQANDVHILEHFRDMLPVYSSIKFRERSVSINGHNYPNYKCAVWTVYNYSFRKTLNSFGLPYGPKSNIIASPVVPFSEPDYFRGFLDGDGSLGITGNGFPFLGWSTNSDVMSQAIVEFIASITGKHKFVRPNKRDSIYNPCVWKEDAQKIASVLYYDKCLALERKKIKAREVADWVRPENMRKVTWKRSRWNEKEDEFIMCHSVEESMESLDRTAKSIKMRLFRHKNELKGKRHV
jgi:hypothetical protein